LTRFWRIGSNQPGVYTADDLTGEGARRAGARWNLKGTPAVYASYHLAAAVLETLVHIGHRKQPVNRYVVAIDVSDSRFDNSHTGVVELTVEDLPAGWDSNPPTPVSQLFGADQFKLGRLGFAVPSAILHEELNLVMNPLHPVFKSAVKAHITRTFAFDPRL
jgi:RES domain-containing protein